MEYNTKKYILVKYCIEEAKSKWKNRYEVAFLIWRYLRDYIWRDMIFKYIWLKGEDRIDYYSRQRWILKRKRLSNKK